VSPVRKTDDLALHYDQGLRLTRKRKLPEGYPLPQPTSLWPVENIRLYEKLRAWLLSGGADEHATNTIYLPIAGHVFGLNLKPHTEYDLDADLERALEYTRAKGSGKDWLKACRNGLIKFRRFMRLERGLGEESKVTPFDPKRVTAGLPLWLVNELERYQRLQQRNWRDARVEQNIHRFWSGYLRIWRYLVEKRGVQKIGDIKRQFILDYVDLRLGENYAVSGVNSDLRCLHTFLLFLQEEGYNVPNSILRIPGLKTPDSLPKYLTDEQVKLLRGEMERSVSDADQESHKRLALLIRAAFYLLWQGGMRLGEVEELRLEDLDLEQKRLSVRDGKGRKDRTVYLAGTAIRALQEYLVVRGEGSGDHVFLYRNAPLRKDIIRANLQYAGERVGVKVYPHRLRHTCATQLLNAGCRVTSIQRFLGHKKLSSTMIYARAHDQTVAEDYFAAMERVEQRLAIEPEPVQEKEIVKAQPVLSSSGEMKQILFFVEQLTQPEISVSERLSIAEQLRQLFGAVSMFSAP
jgi:site-specific recombinase XerD